VRGKVGEIMGVREKMGMRERIVVRVGSGRERVGERGEKGGENRERKREIIKLDHVNV
jgi:hypothetical protein